MIPPVKPRKPKPESELDTLARTVWGEARGESREGRIAVAWVALNRARAAARYLARNGRRHPLFGDGSVDAACRAPLQFSCWNAGDPNLIPVCTVTDRDTAFRECLEAARAVLAAEAADPTGGATHYHAQGVTPAWAKGQASSATIGRHVFYSGVR